MAKLTEKQCIKLSTEFHGLQQTIADDLDKLSGQLRNKYIPSWSDDTFDEKLAYKWVKWLRGFDTTMYRFNKEFIRLFLKKEMK